jgi:hypothetical protein
VRLKKIEEKKKRSIVGTSTEPSPNSVGRPGRAIITRGPKELGVQEVRDVYKWVSFEESIPSSVDFPRKRLCSNDRSEIDIGLDVLPTAVEPFESTVKIEFVGNQGVVRDTDSLVASV